MFNKFFYYTVFIDTRSGWGVTKYNILMTKKLSEIIIIVMFVFLLVLGIPRASIYLNNLGIDAHVQGRYKDAAQYFKMAIYLSPASSESHFNLAGLYADMKDKEAAVAEYEKLIAIDPQYLPAYHALAVIYIDSNRFDEAMRIAQQAIDKIGTDEALVLLKDVSAQYAAESTKIGSDALSAGDANKGLNFLNKAIGLNPDYVVPYQVLGFFYYQRGNSINAVECANNIIRVAPKNPIGYQLLGDVFFNKQEFSAAIDQYKKAVLFNSADVNIYNNIGLSFMNLEQFDEARRYLGKAVLLRPDDVHLRYSLASICRDAQRFKDAQELYKQVIAMKQDYPNVYNDLGDIYLHLQDVDSADKSFNEEIKNNLYRLQSKPSDVESLNNLAYAYARTKKEVEARNIIDLLIKNNPAYRQAYLTLAVVCEEQNDFDCARQALNDAKALSKETNFIDRELLRLVEKVQEVH
ncbi:MAG: tetratricopeptide repeat protein [Candidatus Omnitrophota bacterium]